MSYTLSENDCVSNRRREVNYERTYLLEPGMGIYTGIYK